jgi:DNA polymerase III delta prime subunit
LVGLNSLEGWVQGGREIETLVFLLSLRELENQRFSHLLKPWFPPVKGVGFYIETKYYNNIMKYYETTLNEYVENVEKYNIHNNHELLNRLNKEKDDIKNMIFYGPSGVGKYSQMLYLLTNRIGRFKSQQKLYVQKDAKEKYIYTMSDIYFEIDMGLLGCNSKTLWHEIYLQILDIIIIKPKKMGIIVCKNFHLIHSELLDIFYSYIQDSYKNITIKYIIITEQISFIPSNLLNNFIVINIPRPLLDEYRKILPIEKECIIGEIVNIKDIYKNSKETNNNITLKIICNNIIEQIENSDKIIITEFRDILYEILTYGLDIGECIWYILSYFYKKGMFLNEKIFKSILIDLKLDYKMNETNNTKNDIIKFIMEHIYEFLKKFNNNYRPITHLESIFILFIIYYRKSISM